jgi:hypothetical protein
MADSDAPQTADRCRCEVCRVEAAAAVIREQIGLRLDEATGREMSEEIARLALAAADEVEGRPHAR